MPNLFFATDEQALNIHEHDSGVFLELIDGQPHEDLTEVKCDGNFVIFSLSISQTRKWRREVKLPHPSGEYLVKETWDYTVDENGNIEYIYKATHPQSGVPAYDLVKKEYDGRLVERISRAIKWRSPVTMPAAAVRYPIKVDATVKQKNNGLWYAELKWRKV